MPIAWMAAKALLEAAVTMVLWNHVMPDLFGLPELTWWKALCVLMLGQMLFSDRSGRKHDAG